VYFSTFSSVKHYLISEKGMRSNTDYCGVEILFQNFISAKRGLNRKKFPFIMMNLMALRSRKGNAK
jgi:hypothetical protein